MFVDYVISRPKIDGILSEFREHAPKRSIGRNSVKFSKLIYIEILIEKKSIDKINILFLSLGPAQRSAPQPLAICGGLAARRPPSPGPAARSWRRSVGWTLFKNR